MGLQSRFGCGFVLYVYGSLNTDVILSRLFQTPTQSPSSNPTPPTRRRRAIPFNEVVSVIIKSSRTPISMGTFSPQLIVTFDTYSCHSSLYLSPAEAVEALRTLTSLCPEFLKSVVIDRDEWLQMTAGGAVAPPSPSKRDDEQVLKRSAAAVNQGSPGRMTLGGSRAAGFSIRDVKERIRRELEA